MSRNISYLSYIRIIAIFRDLTKGKKSTFLNEKYTIHCTYSSYFSPRTRVPFSGKCFRGYILCSLLDAITRTFNLMSPKKYCRSLKFLRVILEKILCLLILFLSWSVSYQHLSITHNNLFVFT